MPRHIYDDPKFFAGYSRLPRSIEGLAGAPEWPALRALLPSLSGRRVVDLGCGFGWFCRWARENGAAEVLGLDVSDNMLARAESDTSDSAIRYIQADLEHLDLPAASFDVAYSSLALHYVADFAGLVAAVHRGLVPGAPFVFSIEHPIFMASRAPGWLKAPDGRKFWPVDSYQSEGPRTTAWFTEGVVKQHRTMGTTLTLLIRAGFIITHVEEWAPTDAQVAKEPELADERERPTFLIVAARKGNG